MKWNNITFLSVVPFFPQGLAYGSFNIKILYGPLSFRHFEVKGPVVFSITSLSLVQFSSNGQWQGVKLLKNMQNCNVSLIPPSQLLYQPASLPPTPYRPVPPPFSHTVFLSTRNYTLSFYL
jgi:hypothetical protein